MGLDVRLEIKNHAVAVCQMIQVVFGEMVSVRKSTIRMGAVIVKEII